MTAVPYGFIRAYARQLSRLKAEHTLMLMNAVALGTGHMKEGDATALYNRLSRLARVERPRPASPVDFAGMGIGYREVSR